MTIELVELTRPADFGPYEWEPFETTLGFTDAWWNHIEDYEHGKYPLWSARIWRKEVARAQLDFDASFDHYENTPVVTEPILEIAFFEVDAAHRGQGIARRVVGMLAEAYPGRRIVAFSEEAEDFWDSFGWSRYRHPEGDDWYRPLYIAPAGWRL